MGMSCASVSEDHPRLNAMKPSRVPVFLYLMAVSLIVLSACTLEEVSNPLPGEGDTSQSADGFVPEDTGGGEDTEASEDTVMPDDIAASDDIALPEDVSEADTEAQGLGYTPTSCGAVDQGLTPVDCTQYGDVDADCVFSNHCLCSVNNGFVCEGWKEGDGKECEPGLVCVPKTPPVDPMEVGHVPTSCGASDQGLIPIDCTQYGDKNAVCVFSNHCMCSTDDGFECETPSQWGGNECDPGVYCKPVE